jgi:hypothetical protein
MPHHSVSQQSTGPIASLALSLSCALTFSAFQNDIFQQKIVKSDLGTHFPNYTGIWILTSFALHYFGADPCLVVVCVAGGLEYEPGLEFIRERYFERNSNPNKQIYCHVTEGTNTENIRFVWKSTRHIILEQAVHRIIGTLNALFCYAVSRAHLRVA